jgi:hypothetical protein
MNIAFGLQQMYFPIIKNCFSLKFIRKTLYQTDSWNFMNYKQICAEVVKNGMENNFWKKI